MIHGLVDLCAWTDVWPLSNLPPTASSSPPSHTSPLMVVRNRITVCHSHMSSTEIPLLLLFPAPPRPPCANPLDRDEGRKGGRVCNRLQIVYDDRKKKRRCRDGNILG